MWLSHNEDVCCLLCAVVCLCFCGCVRARPSFQTDVLAGQIVSSVLVPFVALAGRCFKAGNFNDDVMHTVDKIINRSSFLYTRHALAVKVRVACALGRPSLATAWP